MIFSHVSSFFCPLLLFLHPEREQIGRLFGTSSRPVQEVIQEALPTGEKRVRTLGLARKEFLLCFFSVTEHLIQILDWIGMDEASCVGGESSPVDVQPATRGPSAEVPSALHHLLGMIATTGGILPCYFSLVLGIT